MVLLFVRYILLVRGKIEYKVIGISFFIGTVLFILNDIQTDAFQSVLNAKTFEEAVNRSYDKALAIMDEYPYFGLGLGGYSSTGTASYPHNIFLEVITEMGFAGLLVITITSLYAMKYNCFSWKAINDNDTYPILFLLAVFIRVNASGDLTENIYFFALLFTMIDQQHMLSAENIQKD